MWWKARRSEGEWESRRVITWMNFCSSEKLYDISKGCAYDVMAHKKKLYNNNCWWQSEFDKASLKYGKILFFVTRNNVNENAHIWHTSLATSSRVHTKIPSPCCLFSIPCCKRSSRRARRSVAVGFCHRPKRSVVTHAQASCKFENGALDIWAPACYHCILFLPRLSRSRSQKIYRSGLQMSARWVYVIKIQMYAILARGRKNNPDLWCPAAFALIANYKNSS